MTFSARKRAADWRVAAPSPDISELDVPWVAIEHVFTGLRTPYDPDDRLYDLTPGQRAVYALDWVRKEVCNGGFDQLFRNPTGYLAPEAIEGAAYIGAEDYAAILRCSAAIFPGGVVPRDRDRRIALMDRGSRDEVFEPLEDEFYALLHDPERDIDRVMGRYVLTHADEFFVDGVGDTRRGVLRRIRRSHRRP